MTRLLDRKSLLDALGTARRPYHDQYYAMYSSVFGGIVTDPTLMLVPLDDHLVHRGDGVFESLKCVSGGIYNLRAHLERLAHSAHDLDLAVPAANEELRTIVVDTVRAGGRENCSIRVLVSRGPGSFNVNPYDCPQPQLYVAVTRLDSPFMQRHPRGARVRTSVYPAKDALFAVVKNCNYLPNVLMKKEAVDRQVDFVMAFDRGGFLAEGATENMGIVNAARELCFPRLEGILQGTTMMRAADLSQGLIREGLLTGVRFTDIRHEDILAAPEAIIVGTTHNAVAVTEYDGVPIGGGEPGPVYRALAALLDHDTAANPEMRTEVGVFLLGSAQ